jgi:hypothetical protein
VVGFLAAAIVTTARAQCVMSCPTSDDVAVQAELDAAAVNGGGVVQLEPRVYSACYSWIVGSNTHLHGAGRGATVVRGSANVVGRTVSNAYVGATIGIVGSDNVRVSDLTIDHATCERHANGVAFLPTGLSSGNVEAYDGTPSTNGVVERVEVFGSPTFHSYMIWNLRGQHMKILDNWVDGRSSSQSAQEGIESYGGLDVLISGNTVKNIGNACVNVGSAGIANSDVVAVTVANNFLENCRIGVNLGTASGPFGPISMSQTRVLGNAITNIRQTGIDVAVVPGTTERDLIISNNTIRDINVSLAAGIWLRGNGGSLADDAVVANSIHGNHIENIRGANAHGVRLSSYPNVRVLDNTIVGIENGAVYAVDANNIEITGNRIEDGGIAPVQLWSVSTPPMSQFSVDRNHIQWPGASPSILVVGAKFGTIRDNIARRTDNLIVTPVIAANTCGVTIGGNVAWYYPSWPGTSTPLCP